MKGFFLMVLQYGGALVSCGDVDEQEDGLKGWRFKGLYFQELLPEEVQDDLQVEGCVFSHENQLYYPAAQPHIEELLQLIHKQRVLLLLLFFGLQFQPLYATADGKQQIFEQSYGGINLFSNQELYCYLYVCKFLDYITVIERTDAYLIDQPFHFQKQIVVPLSLAQLKQEAFRDLTREQGHVVLDAIVAGQDLEELRLGRALYICRGLYEDPKCLQVITYLPQDCPFIVRDDMLGKDGRYAHDRV